MISALRWFFLLPAAFLISGCADVEEQRAIASAAAGYVQMDHPNEAFRIKVEAVDQGYARAVATPLNATTDPTTIFLTRAGGSWKGILMGTAFDPGVYRELNIPPKVQVP